ncbi:MAG: protein-glutamate O-methyltransferase CheR [Ghiorsea sp.]
MKEYKFTWFSDFLLRRSGIVINKDKVYLVHSRLKSLMNKHGFEDINALVLKIKSNENSPLSVEAIDLMTTNETLFFRDGYPYDALEKLIFPELLLKKKDGGPIRIWSAASSRGQEAYSIAMVATERVPFATQRVKIAGTDLSAESVDFAKASMYSKVDVQRGLSAQRLKQYFTQEKDAWRVHDKLRQMIQFKTGNLVENSLVAQMAGSGPFDVVFLRNVLIYFSVEERKNVVDRIARTMLRGGYLITGAADLPMGNASKWEKVDFAGKRLWKLV